MIGSFPTFGAETREDHFVIEFTQGVVSKLANR